MKEMQQVGFWRAVEKCLSAFYEFEPTDAHEKSLELRKRIEDLGPKTSTLIYHDEPLHVASDIAGKHEAKFPDEWMDSYQKILEECHW